MPHRPKYGRVFAALLTAGVASHAHAAGFALMEQNASGLGNAYAGQAAAAEDASTIFFNPAGMTYIKGRQVVGALNLVSPSSDFDDEGSTTPIPPLGGDGGNAGDLAFIPNAYLSWELLADKVWLGIGVNAPFGLKTEYDEDWVGRFHAIKSDVKTININPSIAWKAAPGISLGAGINVMKFDAELSNRQLLPGPQQPIATVEGDDWGWGWNVGVMFDLAPGTRVGVAYRSKIDLDLEGDVSAAVGPPFAALLNSDITADIELPDTLSVALSHQLTPKLQLLADYTWTGWDSIQTIEIYRDNGTGLSYLPLNFDDSWRIGIGLNYQYDDSLKLRVGFAYDRSPVDDEFRSPRLPDEDRYWLALGAQWKSSKQLTIDVGYAYVWPEEPDVNLPSVDSDPPTGFSASPKGNLVGDYDAHVHIFSVQASYSF